MAGLTVKAEGVVVCKVEEGKAEEQVLQLWQPLVKGMLLQEKHDTLTDHWEQ